MERICGFCGGPATQRCTACETTYYCSKQHQRRHWKRHSLSCRPYKVEENAVLGRHCVAVRTIKPGELILAEERPLVHGPLQNSPPVCLSCYRILSRETAVPCHECGWPLCPDCPEHGPECGFTASRRQQKVSIRDFGLPHPSYQCVNVVRALSLKGEKPDAYRRLMSLEDHGERIRETTEPVFEEASRVVAFIKRFFKAEDITEQEIRKIVGVLQINGHEVPTTEPGHMAVYDRASLIEHSCRANCSKSFTSNGGLLVHAAVPIQKREHISICYTDSLWGAANRRHHLLRTKFFECHCERCTDPTELTTMFNAVKCSDQQCPGSALPKTFLTDATLDYACDVCNRKLPAEEIDETLERIGLDLSLIEKNDVDACKRFLARYKNVLHENHYYNVDAGIALAQLIGQRYGIQEVGDSMLDEKIRLCKRLDQLLKTLAPAENRVRGLLLFELHAALAEFGRRRDQREALSSLIDSRNCLQEASRLLQREPEVLPEGKVALRAAANLREMDAMLRKLCTQAPTTSILEG